MKTCNTRRSTFLSFVLMVLFIFAGLYGYSQVPVDTVCAGANEFYKYPSTPGSTFEWFISEGGRATYGVDTKKDSIRVAWSNTNVMAEDYVKVIETNKYGKKGDTVMLKVLRFPAPTATISGSDTLFDGNTGTDKIKIDLTGTSPWDIVYNDGKTDVTITDIESSPHFIQTRSLSNPPEVHSFTLVSVKNKSGCPGQVSGSANITVSPPVKAGSIIHN